MVSGTKYSKSWFELRIHHNFRIRQTYSFWLICKNVFAITYPKSGYYCKYSRDSEFIRLPYRFPWGTVLVDRAAYRTFLTVFRDFCLKARTLPRFKFYRPSVLTLIFRKNANRTVPKHWPFFVILKFKTLIWWNLLEKREPYRDVNFKFSHF